MPLGRQAAAAITLVLALGVGGAASPRPFRIPPGSLGEVATTLGLQAGITIAIPDADLAARRSAGVDGDYSVRAAIRQALKGTGAEAVFYDDTTVRLVRARVAQPPPRDMAPPPAAPPTDVDELVVTASKQDIVLGRYPGSAKVVDLDPDRLARNAAQGTSAIAEAMPTLSGTNLGRGRNKIYVRGVADSSFNGPTQATVGQYLGEVRLNYNAPDPDLNLYDLRRVEVLSGPQGTLYGASSLGGVVRLVPNTPQTEDVLATAAAGLSTTRHGGVGHDAAVMINLPLGEGRGALRYVAYGVLEAGYIDDPARGLVDVNRTRILGQRLAWRVDDWAGWTLDVGGVVQTIDADDGQYTRRGEPPLTRRTALAQPFRNDFHLGYVTGRRGLGDREVVTTTSVAGYDLASVFDATPAGPSATPRRFEEKNTILLVNHETRVTGGGRRAPWVAGFTAVYNINRLSRSLGPLGAPEQIAGVRNSALELSAFGQATRPLSSRINVTLGGRLTAAGSDGRLLDQPTRVPEEDSRKQLRFVPMAALDWRLTRSLSVYGHYQEGYRAGGFAIAPQGAASATQEFVADDLSEIEFGVRWRDPRRARLSGRLSLFTIDWNNIQADLVDTAGLPFTANIGDGRIYGIDVEARWRVTSALTLTASGFFNDTFLDDPPAGADPGKRTLPNIPRDGVRAEVEWRRALGRNVVLSGGASLRYVGESFLAAGSAFDAGQGDYLVAGLGARLDVDRFGVSLDISNLGDARANTFAFGNPFGLSRGDQVTPLRPRTVRVGLDARF